eukprot:732891-Rhodomonas_salina.2
MSTLHVRRICRSSTETASYISSSIRLGSRLISTACVYSDFRGRFPMSASLPAYPVSRAVSLDDTDEVCTSRQNGVVSGLF